MDAPVGTDGPVSPVPNGLSDAQAWDRPISPPAHPTLNPVYPKYPLTIHDIFVNILLNS